MSERLASLSHTIADAGWQLYFDVSPLLEEHWTGIPQVAAGLARALRAALPGHTAFFYRHDIVTTDAVEDALGRESGLYLDRQLQRGHARRGAVPLLGGHAPSAGIYPSVKPVNSLFPVECSLYHDISTLILPRYHRLDNIRHHLPGLVEDIRTNTVTFCVSQATADDLIAYLGAPPAQVTVAHNGVSWPWWFPIQRANDDRAAVDDPYYLVLGTREPRKNLSRVFEAFAMFPELLDTARLLIVGKTGWLTEREIVPPRVAAMIESGRIVATGYVSSYEKYRLLCGARATIYASLFEGFGLPVLESLSVGTPCVVSWSSAMPEVSGDACVYFDPLSAEDLATAIWKVAADDPKRNPGHDARCRAIAATFTWEAMLEVILARLVPALAAAGSRVGAPWSTFGHATGG